MDVATYPVGLPASSSSTSSKLRVQAVVSTPAGSDRIAAAMLQKAANAYSEPAADSTTSTSDAIASSSSTGATSYSAALLWHSEDDTTVDQDDGWQLVGSKAPHHARPVPSSSVASTASSSKGQVCGRCGMRGHLSARCRQPQCSRCNKWWHTEDECARSCSTCGSLDHRVCCGALCKSYKCRECGLYGHVYAECPNIRCNLCSEIGHKALDCPSIVCNICKQKGHKAVNCPQPRHSAAAASKPSSSSGSEVQHLQLMTGVPAQLLQNCSSSCSSVASPVAASSPAGDAEAATPRKSGLAAQPAPAAGAAAPAAATTAAAASSGAEVHDSVAAGDSERQQQEVPLAQQPLVRPGNLAEQQQLQQQHSRLLGQLLKVAPDVAVSCLDDSSKLRALYTIEPQFLSKLLLQQQQPSNGAEQVCSRLEAAVASAQRQVQALQHLQQQHSAGQALTPTQQQHPGRSLPSAVQQRLSAAHSGCASPAGPATPEAGAAAAAPAAAAAAGEDAADATQGIKPGDLASQHARALQEEFGDMLPSRWQQLPSWRQLEARLSFPDGNYVQRRLQFREKRRQLQLMTLQVRAGVSGSRQQGATRVAAPAPAAKQGTSAAGAAARAPASGDTAQQQQLPAKAAGAPCSYAAVLAGARMAPAAAAAGAAPASGSSSGTCRPIQVPSSPFAGAADSSAASPAATAAAGSAAASGVAVCSRCGMLGHASSACVQPRCSRCHLWWHTEAQCSSACAFCGSLDHSGDAEQPSSCKSFRCKACKMFGHTAAICPHVQLHQQQLQRQGSSLSSSSLQQPLSPLAFKAAGSANGGNGSSGGGAQPLSNGGSDSSMCPPDSPGLGQHGVKPKDLLPEHAKALQEEFPAALPPGWQQMASWRMVEERLHVVAVEGAVFSKRRQMWRDRRKHYQALTAAALAAAARSAAASNADQARAARSSSLGVPCDSSVSSSSCRADSGASSPGGADDLQQQQQQQQAAAACEHSLAQQQQQQEVGSTAEAQQQAQPLAVSAAGPQAQRQLSELQSDDPVVVPEWQQQQHSSLFSLVDPAPGSGLGLDVGMASSSFSCDTAFVCSMPASTQPHGVMLGHLADGLACSGSSALLSAPAGSSCMPMPGASGAMGLAALTAGRGAQVHAALSSPLPVPPGPCGTPLLTPRSAAQAAAAAGASRPVLQGGYPAGMMSGEMGKLPSMPYSPLPSMPSSAGMMRSPLGYPGPPPSSPMDMHSAAAAAAMGRGMQPAGMGMHGPALSHQHQQHMMVAQRQSQLQQQLMLQGRYSRPIEQQQQQQLASPQHHQQQHMLLQMQMQQQAHAQAQAHAHAQAQQQQHMRMQRRVDQAYMMQQQQQAAQRQQQQQQQYVQKLAPHKPGPSVPEEAADNGELDDKLGVLGVLGLQ